MEPQADPKMFIGDTRLQKPLTGINLNGAGCNFHQRGFAGPVAPNEAHAVTRIDGKVRTGQQRRGTKRQIYIAESEKRRSHECKAVEGTAWL